MLMGRSVTHSEKRIEGYLKLHLLNIRLRLPWHSPCQESISDGLTMDSIGSSRCKIVVVGDTQCGKTALLHVFAKDCYPENYVPTVFENYTASFEIDKHRIELNMWDTSGKTASYLSQLSDAAVDIKPCHAACLSQAKTVRGHCVWLTLPMLRLRVRRLWGRIQEQSEGMDNSDRMDLKGLIIALTL
ncbi:hypothetical protein CHARACLAT_004078 [Characodon lateralis]|uniref:Rho-related GTP-binding protein RhoE n=1 Tax=Characodon lateralis TaxID=208331 RepID=A0ABU7EHY5_9TELE|nr:hypothetical protein [Characodon lateralis]